MTRDNKYDVSCEMVAQSNSRGGMIVVGIDTYTGVGTGIIRAMEEEPEVTFENQESAHEFTDMPKNRSQLEKMEEKETESDGDGRRDEKTTRKE